MKILVVEDDPFVADDLKDKLEHLQYRVTGIADSCDSALFAIGQERPDLALLDIELRGELTGIDLAEKLARVGIPYIFLSSIQDMNTYLRASKTAPLKNLAKPIDLLNLRNALLEINLSKASPVPSSIVHLITDRGGNKFPIDPNDIAFILAGGSYCDVHFADESRSTLTMPMGEFVDKLAWPDVIRISRSAAINLKHVKRLRGNEVVMIVGDPLRITDSYKDALNSHLKTF